MCSGNMPRSITHPYISSVTYSWYVVYMIPVYTTGIQYDQVIQNKTHYNVKHNNEPAVLRSGTTNYITIKKKIKT